MHRITETKPYSTTVNVFSKHGAAGLMPPPQPPPPPPPPHTHTLTHFSFFIFLSLCCYSLCVACSWGNGEPRIWDSEVHAFEQAIGQDGVQSGHTKDNPVANLFLAVLLPFASGSGSIQGRRHSRGCSESRKQRRKNLIVFSSRVLISLQYDWGLYALVFLHCQWLIFRLIFMGMERKWKR